MTMSFLFRSGQPPLNSDAPNSGGANNRSRARKGSTAVDDEDLARRCAVRLLITASLPSEVQALARRIHLSGERAGSPFLETRARDLPIDPGTLRDTCAGLLDAAAGGSVLITDVEEMPPTVQDLLIDLLAELELVRAPSPTVRLMAGTTVSLLDRFAAGAFSEQLFYELNIIHIIAKGALQEFTVGGQPAERADRAARTDAFGPEDPIEPGGHARREGRWGNRRRA
jgi:hypothetical protein